MGIVVDLSGNKVTESIHLECPGCGNHLFKLCGTADGIGWLLQWAECGSFGYKMDFMKDDLELEGVNENT